MMLLPYSFFLFSCPPLPMQLATFSRSIDTTEEVLWKLLLDKIERPGRYVPEAVESEITERPEEGVWVRRMKTEGPEIVERITADEQARRVTYAALENPVFDGTIVNEIERGSSGEVVLTFHAEGTPKGDVEEVKAQTEEQLRSSVLHIKRVVEDED